jgi:hypothetical protein
MTQSLKCMQDQQMNFNLIALILLLCGHPRDLASQVVILTLSVPS